MSGTHFHDKNPMCAKEMPLSNVLPPHPPQNPLQPILIILAVLLRNAEIPKRRLHAGLSITQHAAQVALDVLVVLADSVQTLLRHADAARHLFQTEAGGSAVVCASAAVVVADVEAAGGVDVPLGDAQVVQRRRELVAGPGVGRRADGGDAGGPVGDGEVSGSGGPVDHG